MASREYAVARPREAVLATNKVIRNTYILLSMTLLFSALTAGASIALRLGHGPALIMSFVALGLLWFVLPRTANSAAGLGVVFAITGLLGAGLGPMLAYYLSMPNGSEIVMTAMGGTGVVFLGLSGYALGSRRDFSFMGGFLVVGLLVALVAVLANIFLQIPALALALDVVIIMIMSGYVLYYTSMMVHRGETNYLVMTIGIYIAILNIFTSLLHLLGASND
jgi:modulator of FtsH protease